MNTHSPKNHHPPVGRHPDRPARVRVRPPEEPSDPQAGGFSSILTGYPLTLGVTALSALLLVTVAAIPVCQSPDPMGLILPISAATLGVAALIGGTVAGKLNPACPLAASLVCGSITAALMILLSLLLGDGGSPLRWIMGLGILPLHLLGGFLTRPRPKAPAHNTARTARRHPSRR